MRRLDWFKRVDFIDIYTTQSCPLEPQLLLQRFHVQEINGPIISGCGRGVMATTALAATNRELARIPTVLKVLEWAYIKFLAYRPKNCKDYSARSAPSSYAVICNDRRLR